MKKKRIVVASTGASSIVLLTECLKLIRKAEEYESCLIMSRSAEITLKHEMSLSKEDIECLAELRFCPMRSGQGRPVGLTRRRECWLYPAV